MLALLGQHWLRLMGVMSNSFTNILHQVYQKPYIPYILVFLVAISTHLVVIGEPFWQETYPPDAADEPRYVFYAESIREGRGMHAPGREEQATAYVMPSLPLLFAVLDPSSLVRAASRAVGHCWSGICCNLCYR